METRKQILDLFITEFKKLKGLCDGAIVQLSDRELFERDSENENSVAIIMNHMAGNMISRWTDFLTTDGEKPNRDRDKEFEDPESIEKLRSRWEQGWKIFFDTLITLKEEDLDKTVFIRKEPHSVLQALLRQQNHYAYHTGQIVLLSKAIRKDSWKTLSIPKGKSNEYLTKKFEPGK